MDEQLTGGIIGAAIEVHRALGPGLLESAYQACLAQELATRGHAIECEKALRVSYKGVELDCAYRLDFVVDDRVVVEVKTVTRIEPVHEAQIISYLKLSGYHLGLLINFHAPRLTQGVRRFVNELPEHTPLITPRTSTAEIAETAEIPPRSLRPLR